MNDDTTAIPLYSRECDGCGETYQGLTNFLNPANTVERDGWVFYKHRNTFCPRCRWLDLTL